MLAARVSLASRPRGEFTTGTCPLPPNGRCHRVANAFIRMDTHTFTYSDYHFGKLTVDPARTCGRGGVLAPVIQVSAIAEFGAINLGSNSRSVLVQELSGTAVIEHAGGFALPVAPMPIQRLFAAEPASHHIESMLRVTHPQLEAIEAARKNGDVGITLLLRLSFLVLAKTEVNPVAGFQIPHVVVDAGVASICAMIKVPQSTWVKDVLNQVGFGQVLLFEFPAYPVSALAGLGEAFEAAKRAQQQFNVGEYDLAVGLCRTAVQPLRNHLLSIKARSKGAAAADWAEKIGTATFDWLFTVTGKTHGVSSSTHYQGSSGRFSRLDAHMILTTTVSVLAYAARMEAIHSESPTAS